MTVYVILMCISSLGIIFFLINIHILLNSPELFVELLLITCYKDSTWLTWQNSTASTNRIDFLKMLQSKALTGTLVRKSVFHLSRNNSFCFLF